MKKLNLNKDPCDNNQKPGQAYRFTCKNLETRFEQTLQYYQK